MKIPTIEMTVTNIVTNQTKTVVLPDENLQYQLLEICSPLANWKRELRVVKCASLWNYQAKPKEAILGLNGLLLTIEKLDESEQEKIFDLFSVQEKKQYDALVYAYMSQGHYDVVGENAFCDDREKRLRAGALYLLALCPDIAIVAEGEGLLCNEYRQNLFYAGLRAGEILLIGGKYYVPDCILVQQPKNSDLDFWEEYSKCQRGVSYDE